MPGPEGYLPDKLQPKEPRLTVEQLQQKGLEIVAKAANLSNQYLERLGKDHVQDRLAGIGYSKEDIQPGGKIHDDILFRGGVSQTMALVSWALQRTPLEGPNDSPERTPHKLAEVMRPIDRAFTLAAAAIGVDQEGALQGLLGGRTSIQLSAEQRSAGLLQLREILRIKDPTIPDAEVAQRLLLLRQNLPLHTRKLEDAQFNSTDEVLRALSTISIAADQSSMPIPEINMTRQEASPVDSSMLAVRLPYKYSDRASHREQTKFLKIVIPRSWGLTRKDVSHTTRDLKKQKGRLSANEALAYASVDLKMRALPRALANGVVSTAEIGDIMPLPDGREVIIGKHIVKDGDKQQVRYSYDIATSLGTARSPEQLQKDQQLARDHIFREMSNKWFVSAPAEQENEALQSWLRIAKGRVNRHQINQLNIPPTDGKFVLATRIEEDTENGEATYSYDLSIPENKPDKRTPEQKERDRQEALRRIHTAMMGKNQE